MYDVVRSIRAALHAAQAYACSDGSYPIKLVMPQPILKQKRGEHIVTGRILWQVEDSAVACGCQSLCCELTSHMPDTLADDSKDVLDKIKAEGTFDQMRVQVTEAVKRTVGRHK